jgi:hypothetical protein
MKVGDYVRTKSGIIGKIESKNYIGYSDWIIDTLYYNDDEIIDNWTCGVKEYDIIKSSPNIIDLIEVGDYVNGKRVIRNCLQDGGNIILFEDGTFAHNDEIKSIVTKEQFENIEYKVGEIE